MIRSTFDELHVVWRMYTPRIMPLEKPWENKCMGSIGMRLHKAAFGCRCSAISVKCLGQEHNDYHNVVPGPGLKPVLLDPEPDGITIRPPHLYSKALTDYYSRRNSNCLYHLKCYIYVIFTTFWFPINHTASTETNMISVYCWHSNRSLKKYNK